MHSRTIFLSLVAGAMSCANTNTNACAKSLADNASEAGTFCSTATSESSVPSWAASCSSIKNVLKECACQFSNESDVEDSLFKTVPVGNQAKTIPIHDSLAKTVPVDNLAKTIPIHDSLAKTVPVDNLAKTPLPAMATTLATTTRSTASSSSTSAVAAATPNLPSGKKTAASGSVIGYAAGTTGGGSGAGTTVTSCTELSSALKAGGVIRISGTLAGCGILDVPSDTSVIGVGANSGMTDGGLRIKNQNNVIIQNLKMHNPPTKGDLIAIQKSTLVWIDHMALSTDSLASGDKDLYDGMVDVSHAADLITVSFCTFQDHFKVSLVGHSDSNSAEDTGHLQITYHNNYWNNVSSRVPSIRFGTAHIFNNCYEKVEASGIHSRMGAKVLVEGNSFTDVKRAIVTDLDSKQAGFAVQKNNIFTNSNIDITQESDFTPPYAYSVADPAGICASVKSSAGTSASL